jgi:hypothetical protein
MRFTATLAAWGALCLAVSAAENPQVAAIHDQIKTLRAEEKVTLKTVHAWYEGIIKQDKLTAAVLLQQRKDLKKQEDGLLALATTESAKEAIHKHYDSIRAVLREDSKLDAKAIGELRKLEHAHEKQLAETYKAKIQALEAAAKAAASNKTPPKKK